MSEIVNADPAPQRFRDFRARFELSQQQAAELLGVSMATWRSWETSARPQVAARLLVTILVAKPELIELLRDNSSQGGGQS